MLTKDNLKKYNIAQTPVLYKKLKVYISMPHLLYRALLAKNICQTALLQFIGIKLDLQTLKIPSTRTIKDLTCANCEIIRALTLLLGYPNIYRKILYTFPTQVQLDSLSPISNALLKQLLQDTLEVQLKIKKLLFQNLTKDSIIIYFLKQQLTIIKRVKEKYKLVIELKK